jgi:hypothetical protein
LLQRVAVFQAVTIHHIVPKEKAHLTVWLDEAEVHRPTNGASRDGQGQWQHVGS